MFLLHLLIKTNKNIELQLTLRLGRSKTSTWNKLVMWLALLNVALSEGVACNQSVKVHGCVDC